MGSSHLLWYQTYLRQLLGPEVGVASAKQAPRHRPGAARVAELGGGVRQQHVHGEVQAPRPHAPLPCDAGGLRQTSRSYAGCHHPELARTCAWEGSRCTRKRWLCASGVWWSCAVIQKWQGHMTGAAVTSC